MKTLRRPMFRKGGNVGTGVMTGIVDRSNYASGTQRVQEQDITDYISLVKGGDQAQSSDPLTDFLLQFGPNLLSQTPTGGGGLKGLLSTAGGAGSINDDSGTGSQGANSTGLGSTATGGGHGSNWNNGAGGNGGSGGGSAYSNNNPGDGVSGQGNDGGGS